MATTEKFKIIHRLGFHLKAAAQRLKTVSELKNLLPGKKNRRFSKSDDMPVERASGEKRRIEQRILAKIPIRYRVVQDEKETEILFEHDKDIKVSYSLNVSSGGIFLFTQEELNVESLIRLHILLPSTSGFISTLARVMWTDQEGAGLCFVDMKDKQAAKLKEYLLKAIEE